MISVTTKSASGVPATTFARALLHDTTYGADCTGFGYYIKRRAEFEPTHYKREVVNNVSSVPATTFTRALLHDAVYGVDCTDLGRRLYRAWVSQESGVEETLPNIADDLNAWSDAAGVGFPLYNLAINEDLNNLNDDLNVVYSHGISQDDNANNLGDSDPAEFNLYIAIEAADNLSNWLDALAYVYGIYWEALSVAVEDNIGAKGPGNKNKYGWKDGIQFQFEAADIIGLYVAIDDLEEIFADDVEILLAQWIGALTVSIADQMYDSMVYGLMDAISIYAIVPRAFSDGMVFGDSIALRMVANGVPEDTFDFSDVVSLILGYFLSVDSDINNYADAAGSNFPTPLPNIEVSDTFSMSDYLDTPVLSNPATSYLRRYLNDVRD